MAMNTHRFLVEDALVLLRQARSLMAGDSDRSLIEMLDKAIGKLESDTGTDSVKAVQVLRLLANGLAAIPVIQRVIDGFRDQ